jgi:hypothetical protein
MRHEALYFVSAECVRVGLGRGGSLDGSVVSDHSAFLKECKSSLSAERTMRDYQPGPPTARSGPNETRLGISTRRCIPVIARDDVRVERIPVLAVMVDP